MSVFKDFAVTLKQKLNYEPVNVELVSADAISAEVVADVRSVFGDEIVINQIVDPKVTGGLKLKVGDFLVDATVKAQLDNLKKSIDVSDSGDDNLSSKLREQISSFKKEIKVEQVGTVLSVKDGICEISGLSDCMYQEVLEFIDGTKALALNLAKDSIGAIIMGEFNGVKEGDIVRRTEKIMSIPVSDSLIGRVINPLGEPIDGAGSITPDKYYPVEKVAPGVMARKPVDTPLQTGIKSIDGLIPIGRGQRELILGDRQTGKTTIAIDTIINQADQDVICIYVAIGQKESKVATTVTKLRDSGAMSYTIVVDASSSLAAPLLYLAPYAGVAIAEYFADKGKDVLIVYDDLSKHAVAYREMSLLLRRPPGREAYPGDVFYLHSRLLERACNLNAEHGGGSITALPIIETQAGDISAYVPTNVISITDGQIFLETDLFYRGVRPAINVGLSVSRVGGAAQIKPMKKVAGSMKLSLAQFRELEAFSQFSSDLDPKTKQQIERGRRITEILKQKPYSPLRVEQQIVSIYAANNGYFDNISISDVAKHEQGLLSYITSTNSKLLLELKSGNWSEVVEENLKSACADYMSGIPTNEDDAKE